MVEYGKMKRILILGGTGMLGHTLLRCLARQSKCEVFATVRMTASQVARVLPPDLAQNVRPNVSADNFDTMIRAFAAIQPDIVINCIGLIKQVRISLDPINAIQVNSLLPHRISMLCRTAKARLIHISTDCVFSGAKGNYRETDVCDAVDIYGRTKLLGEVDYSPHCLTLRTSIIGHELKGFHGLIEWFLSQNGTVPGYRRALFSGFTSLELAHIIGDYVIPNSELTGIYQVSSDPISKHDLLSIVKRRYGSATTLAPSDDVVIDRSLDSTKFRSATGYAPPAWEALIEAMHADFVSTKTLYSPNRK
jgi:dTDP-4-dehydrorhamnose reductase